MVMSPIILSIINIDEFSWRDSFRWPYWLMYIIAFVIICMCIPTAIRFFQNIFLWGIALTIMVMGIMWFIELPLYRLSLLITQDSETVRRTFASIVSGVSAGARFGCDRILKWIVGKRDKN